MMMGSGKRRRAAMLAARRLRRSRKLAAAQRQQFELLPAGTAPVDTGRLRAYHSGGHPEFVRRGFYQDMYFHCIDCGVEGIWTAARQKWWYEVAGGELSSRARRCAACRARERLRKAEARCRMLAGLGQKAALSKAAELPYHRDWPEQRSRQARG